MRRWPIHIHVFLILMLAYVLTSPTLRSRLGHSVRSVPSALNRLLVPLYQTGHDRRVSSVSGFTTTSVASTSHLTRQYQPQHQYSTMASKEDPVSASTAGETNIPEPVASLPRDAPLEKQHEQNKVAPELPKLSAAEFRVYNRLADMMNAYVSLVSYLPLAPNLPNPSLPS
jgi:hypothetical protein